MIKKKTFRAYRTKIIYKNFYLWNYMLWKSMTGVQMLTIKEFQKDLFDLVSEQCDEH